MPPRDPSLPRVWCWDSPLHHHVCYVSPVSYLRHVVKGTQSGGLRRAIVVLSPYPVYCADVHSRWGCWYPTRPASIRAYKRNRCPGAGDGSPNWCCSTYDMSVLRSSVLPPRTQDRVLATMRRCRSRVRGAGVSAGIDCSAFGFTHCRISLR